MSSMIQSSESIQRRYCSSIDLDATSSGENNWINLISSTDLYSRNQFLALISSCPKTLRETDIFLFFLGIYDTIKSYSSNDEIIRSSVRKKSLKEMDDIIIHLLN